MGTSRPGPQGMGMPSRLCLSGRGSRGVAPLRSVADRGEVRRAS